MYFFETGTKSPLRLLPKYYSKWIYCFSEVFIHVMINSNNSSSSSSSSSSSKVNIPCPRLKVEMWVF